MLQPLHPVIHAENTAYGSISPFIGEHTENSICCHDSLPYPAISGLAQLNGKPVLDFHLGIKRYNLLITLKKTLLERSVKNIDTMHIFL